MVFKQIMIATNSGDHPNYHAVVAHLRDRGYQPFIFEADSIANGSIPFSLELSATGGCHINYDGQSVYMTTLGAAWYRRPNYYGHPKNQLRWLMIKAEYTAAHNSLLGLVPHDAWLSDPVHMRQADLKIPQLLAAARIGFEIPAGTITNDWNVVEKLPSEEIIVKFITRATVPTKQGGYKALPTRVLAKDNLPRHGQSYPGLWQSFIPKKREWRITVVGDVVFSAAIYTSDKARNDWRQRQFDEEHVTFKVEELPVKYQKLCVAYTKYYSLRYGAFDLVERPDGSIVFLEINAGGQFMWLEEKFGLPISKAIADLLIRIAEDRSATAKAAAAKG